MKTFVAMFPLFLCVAEVLGQAKEADHVYSWGSVKSVSSGRDLQLSIRLFPEASRSIRSMNVAEVSPSSGRIYETKPEIESVVFWIAIPPSTRIELHTTLVEAKRVFPRDVPAITGFFQMNDSSSFVPIRGTLHDNDLAVPGSPVEIEGYDWYRGLRLGRLKLSPFVREWGAIKQIETLALKVSISASQTMVSKGSARNEEHFKPVMENLIVNYESAPSLERAAPEWPDTTGSWIEYGRDYLKIAVANDDLYRLTGNDLASWIPGLSTQSTQFFRLFNRGKEIPFRVNDGGDGILDPDDFIEFVGRRSPGDSSYRRIPVGQEEYPLFRNRYTDTSYYWLTWTGTPGVRIDSIPLSTPTTDTLRWFTDLIHSEQDAMLQFVGTDQLVHQDPAWLPGDVWCWAFLDPNQSFDVSFTAKNISSDFPTARLFARYSGWAAQSVSPAHRTSMHLNGSGPLVSDSLNAFQHRLTQVSIGTSSLLAGTNVLQLRSTPTASAINRLIVDWFDVECPRTLQVESDSLQFEFKDLPSRSYRTIELSGLSTATVEVYKVHPEIRRFAPLSITGTGPFIARFADTVGIGDRYFVIAVTKAKKPLIKQRKQFRNLRDSQRSAEYVLITSERFASTAGQYASLIQSTYNLASSLIYVEDIFDEFGFGQPMPEAVREFLKTTAAQWQVIPSYVFLAGDANYDFRNVTPVVDESRREKNIIPALGYPVSDPMLAVFGSMPVPQMYIGRIAISSESEFQEYYDKVQSYITAGNDDWNKRYVLFSGGDPKLPGEVQAFKNVHTQIASSFIEPAPIGGRATLFYKTTNPPSDYGPYSREEVDEILSKGAICINYIGHSGTQTWDNGIGDPSQLQSARQRYPLLLDFGCSTGRFAEPSIKAFGELFTVGPNASAVGYIGNSTLGFSSVAQTLPQEFFRAVLVDSIYEIGRAHLAAKVRRMSLYGGAGQLINRVMMLTNTLIGDPALKLPIPVKPNLSIKTSGIQLATASPGDDDQTAALQITYENTGNVPADTISIRLRSTFEQIRQDTVLRRAMPLFEDTLLFQYPVKGRAGQHVLNVRLNPANTPVEIDTLSNEATVQFFVASNALTQLSPLPGYESPNKELVLLNPQTILPGSDPVVILETDTTGAFINPSSVQQALQGVVTRFSLSSLAPGRSYFWRANVQNSSRPAATGIFRFSAGGDYQWHPRDSSEWSLSQFESTRYTPGLGVELGERRVSIKGTSSGFDEGRIGVIEIDGINVVGNTFDRGHHVAVLDSTNLSLQAVRSFDTFGSVEEAESLRVFLESTQPGRIVVDVISDEGSSNLSVGARNAIKSIGSALIDSVAFRDSWAIVGRKGAVSGTVPEVYVPRYSGRAIVETTFARKITSGSVSSQIVGPAGGWISFNGQTIVPAGGGVGFDIIGIRSNGLRDTLLTNQPPGIISLSTITAETYPFLQFVGRMSANFSGTSPVLTDWSASLIPAAELAVNYQTVAFSADTALEGTPVQIDAEVFNVGRVPAKSLTVNIQALTKFGIEPVQTFFVPRLGADSSISLSAAFLTANRRGGNVIFINVDSAQSVAEAYRSNNVFSKEIFVVSDTLSPSLLVTFDGSQILDGDYVSPGPEIRVTIRDNSPLPITDPNNVVLKLDNRRISLGTNPDSLFESTTGTEKAQVVFRPRLSKGEHLLSVQVQDASGNLADTAAQEIRFRVETAPRLLNVVNIPNPVSRDTYFTFNITGSQVPQNMVLKIYSVGGRLVYERAVLPGELRVGFNRIFWDGRDRDGDLLANGVYFYKLSMNIDGTSAEVIEKLAILR